MMKIKRLTGEETLHIAGEPFLDEHGLISVLDWWSWKFSDVLNDEIRGALAEFIVARLLGATNQPREGWGGSYDFVLADGRTVEVKSSARLQAWENPKLTPIQFSVPTAKGMRPGQGWEDDSTRHADVYVLCALIEEDRSRIDPLDLSQWRFFVATTRLINELAGPSVKPKLSLKKLEESSATECTAHELRRMVEQLI